MTFSYIKPGPKGVSPDKREEAMALAKPLTPKSERRRHSYGSLISSLYEVGGLCPEGKCIKREGHDGECWPT